MHLSDLQVKMVINVKDGKHLGVIVDAEINNEGLVSYFTVMPRRFFKRLFRNEPEVSISFKQIVKIGEDVILVDL